MNLGRMPLYYDGYGNHDDYEDLDVSIINFVEYSGAQLSEEFSRRTKSELYMLIYAKSGNITYHINNRIYLMKVGDFLLVPNDVYWQAYAEEETYMNSYVINFHLNHSNIKTRRRVFPIQFNIGTRVKVEELLDELSKIWREQSKGYKLISRSIVLKILYEIIFRTYHDGFRKHEDKRIEIIKNYVYDNYHREISVEEIANIFNLNANYIGSYFKEKTGYTLRQYANHVRVNKAKNLLMTGKYYVNEVAYHCGYQDVYYFSKVFKDIEGVPPSVYIKG